MPIGAETDAWGDAEGVSVNKSLWFEGGVKNSV
mgnify:FL=1